MFSSRNKYSLSFEDCWKISVDERPNFSELIVQIENINLQDVNSVEFHDESYQSLQEDWKQEIQSIFDELKEKEQVNECFDK